MLGGQHIAKALKMEADARAAQNKVLTKPFQMVTAAVLKLCTPLHIRKLLSGSNNASGHSIHATAISDALDNFLANEKLARNHMWRDERGAIIEPTYAQRVMRMLEEAGLNTAGTNPVCFPIC